MQQNLYRIEFGKGHTLNQISDVHPTFKVSIISHRLNDQAYIAFEYANQILQLFCIAGNCILSNVFVSCLMSPQIQSF